MNVLVRNAWLVPLCPLLGEPIAAATLGRRLKGAGRTWPVVAGIARGLLPSRSLLLGRGTQPRRRAVVYRMARRSPG